MIDISKMMCQPTALDHWSMITLSHMSKRHETMIKHKFETVYNYKHPPCSHIYNFYKW